MYLVEALAEGLAGAKWVAILFYFLDFFSDFVVFPPDSLGMERGYGVTRTMHSVQLTPTWSGRWYRSGLL